MKGRGESKEVEVLETIGEEDEKGSWKGSKEEVKKEKGREVAQRVA